jgi:hypothetical protein
MLGLFYPNVSQVMRVNLHRLSATTILVSGVINGIAVDYLVHVGSPIGMGVGEHEMAGKSGCAMRFVMQETTVEGACRCHDRSASESAPPSPPPHL